jgi:hypothetical protein
MSRAILFVLLLSTSLARCTREATSTKPQEPLQGVWVRDGDLPGMNPADTLIFAVKNGKNMLSFYSAGSPGPNWPSHAETEYRFENGKLNYRNYFGTDNDFFEVESFQWVALEKSFNVKLYQIVRYMSADYRVTYRKVN